MFNSPILEVTFQFPQFVENILGLCKWALHAYAHIVLWCEAFIVLGMTNEAVGSLGGWT